MPNPTFFLWRCCLTGDTKPKIKKKKKEDVVTRPENGEVSIDGIDYKDDLALEYQDTVDEPICSTPAPPPVDLEDTEINLEEKAPADTSSAPSEVDSPGSPITVQLVTEETESKAKKTDIGAGGRMHLSCHLDKKSNKLHIKINKIEFGPHQEWKLDDLEVSCMLLPMHQQSFRRRSKRFNDPIVVQLPAKEKLAASSLRFRIYDHKAITRKYLIGQGHAGIENLCLSPDGSDVNLILDLNSPSTYGIDTRYITDLQSAGAATADSNRAEMLISLEYRALTRKLIVEIIKTRGIGLLTGKKPQDIGVDVKLFGKDKKLIRSCRTAIKKHVIDAEFNEMFMFRMNIEILKESTLYLGLWRSNKKEKIGEVSLGLGSSGYEQQEHWEALTKTDAKTEYRWHPIYK